MAPRIPVQQGLEVRDDSASIEPVGAAADFRELAASEAFMNELVEVLVHSTTDENQPPHIVLNCNGVNQPILRGSPILIKRKYLEILARMKETRYTQVTPNRRRRMCPRCAPVTAWSIRSRSSATRTRRVAPG